jgi:5-methylcytosine-specific restriction enzyme subunit McrC
MLAYTSALNAPEGMLIYCHHDGTAPPTNIRVLNLGTRLTTWMLRLGRTPRHIERELQALTPISPNAPYPHPYKFPE